jgi:hypothetical protein
MWSDKDRFIGMEGHDDTFPLLSSIGGTFQVVYCLNIMVVEDMINLDTKPRRIG